MLQSLSIKNYALIQELELTLSPKLNIITGETGAGKSILLGAIGLLLGNRADVKALLNAEKKCVIEGIFDISQLRLEDFFDENELEYDKECIIRREISPSGKSRAFVNDSPATLSILKSLGNELIDIHSQHESLEIGNNAYQLQTLDAFAQNKEAFSKFQIAYSSYSTTKKELDKLKELASKESQEQDYQQFVLDELSKAKLDEINQTELEAELKQQENTEEIKGKISQLVYLLDESDYATIQQLNEGKNLLTGLQDYATDFEELKNRLDSVSIELSDIFSELSLLQDQFEYDPERVQELRELLDNLYRLQKKHGKHTIEELILLRDELANSLDDNANAHEKISKLEVQLEEHHQKMIESGKTLSETRQKAAVTLGISIEEVIKKIGISNGTIHIQIEEQEPSKTGLDKVEILFSANKGISPQPLKKVASGGEFSRLIFAVKYLLADKTNMPTLIFDEIDTGVSGQIALQMIQMMKEISQQHQIVSISHLPQFAAGADNHYFVYKDHSSDQTISKIRLLSNEERTFKIAQMIGGENPSESAITSAKELVKSIA